MTESWERKYATDDCEIDGFEINKGDGILVKKTESTVAKPDHATKHEEGCGCIDVMDLYESLDDEAKIAIRDAVNREFKNELVLDGIKLVRIDHDNLESDDPIRVSELGIFIGWGGVSAQDKISALFDDMDSVNIYLGYDGNAYPQFRLEKVKLL